MINGNSNTSLPEMAIDKGCSPRGPGYFSDEIERSPRLTLFDVVVIVVLGEAPERLS